MPSLEGQIVTLVDAEKAWKRQVGNLVDTVGLSPFLNDVTQPRHPS
jgi:hypothetical protein